VRIVYHVEPDAVVVLEVFSKKTEATPTATLDNCRRRLAAYQEAAGRRVSHTATFLGLTDTEQRFIDLKLALAAGLRQFRERGGLTQAAPAKQLGFSQSRIAKLEAADASVSVDLMIRSLICVGAGPAEIAKIIRTAAAHKAA